LHHLHLCSFFLQTPFFVLYFVHIFSIYFFKFLFLLRFFVDVRIVTCRVMYVLSDQVALSLHVITFAHWFVPVALFVHVIFVFVVTLILFSIIYLLMLLTLLTFATLICMIHLSFSCFCCNVVYCLAYNL